MQISSFAKKLLQSDIYFNFYEIKENKLKLLC